MTAPRRLSRYQPLEFRPDMPRRKRGWYYRTLDPLHPKQLPYVRGWAQSRNAAWDAARTVADSGLVGFIVPCLLSGKTRPGVSS